MKLRNIFKSIGLAAAASMALVSCDVEELPLNTIIHENFWENRQDVESVVASCYTALAKSDVVTSMIVWGEVRSDNVQAGPQSAGTDLKYLLKGNILETNGYCSYTSFYTCINRCNTLEKYAPMICGDTNENGDPNYTTGDLRQNLAEVRFIRALCYFYLVRTFGAVPYTTVPSMDDSQNYYLPATDGDLIVDSLIMDLKECKDKNWAPKRYVNDDDNSGRVTRNAINALLADLYLWRASNAKVAPAQQQVDYQNCIECCDAIIMDKINEYKEDRYGQLKPQIDKDLYAKYAIPLIQEWAESDANSSDGMTAKAYVKIFGTGHSFESIFELGYQKSNDLSNSAVSDLYGKSNTEESGTTIAAMESMMSNKPDAKYSEDNVFTSYDFRSQENFTWSETGSYNIRKYAVADNMKVKVGTTAQWDVLKVDNRSETANWIFYRLTDIMLMKAEAEVQIADYLDKNPAPAEGEEEGGEEAAPVKSRAPYGNVYTTAKEYYDDAFSLVMAVFDRANPYPYNGVQPTSKPSLSSLNYMKSKFDLLVENERRRELMFEGKRYYDLLRRARRDGNTTYAVSKLSAKFTNNSSVMKIKMAMMEFLYMPYSEDELKRNPLLVQNPAFDKEKKNEVTQ